MATTDKDWNPTRPFVRINSSSEGALARLDGNGHRRGTRRQSDYRPASSLLESLVISQLIALTPSWARAIEPDEAAGEHEVFGRLRRSFQTWTDAPPLPWHSWYDWNLHIEPDEPYQWLRGRGNDGHSKQANPSVALRPIPEFSGHPQSVMEKRARAEKERFEAKLEAVVQGKSMELEWDTGAFGERPGPMFNVGGNSGIDWVWPMTDDLAWARGRSIYDGGHETDDHFREERGEQVVVNTSRGAVRVRRPPGQKLPQQLEGHAAAPPAAEDEEPIRLARSELHPLKAVATVRYEAHRFFESEHAIPATQFMFFTSRRGGYKDFTSLAPSDGKNYEFIVDLPATAGAFLPFTAAVGATPSAPFNRIVLRPGPLVEFDFERFRNASGARASLEQLERFAPRVELMPAKADPKKRQVKITIPIKEFAAALPTAEFYGVVVHLGWPDLDNRQARRVKKCTVKLLDLFKTKLDHDTLREEWRFKVGVNGRWFHYDFGAMRSNDTRALNTELTFFLPEDGAIRVTAHGAEVDLVDDVYDRPRVITLSERDINSFRDPPLVGGSTERRPVNWDRDVDASPKRNGEAVDGSTPGQRAICNQIFDLMFSTFNDQNDPLGIIDAGHGNSSERTFNPMVVSDFIRRFGEGTTKEFRVKGYQTLEVGDSAELVQVNPDLAAGTEIDYELRYSIHIEPQKITE